MNRRVEFLRSDFDCEAALFGSCAKLQYGTRSWKPEDFDDDSLRQQCEQSSGDSTGGDSCVYATQEAQTNILNQYLVQNVLGATTMNKDAIDVLTANVELKRPRACYARSERCPNGHDNHTHPDCDFCVMASPEIRFKPGKSAYNPDLFDEPVTKIVRLLRQNSHILLKLVGRGDLILGRSRRSDDFAEDTSIDSSEGGLHGDKISGLQRDDFDGNDNSDPADTVGSFLDMHSKEITESESDTLELAKGDLGSKTCEDDSGQNDRNGPRYCQPGIN